jgi:hypothetical protein
VKWGSQDDFKEASDGCIPGEAFCIKLRTGSFWKQERHKNNLRIDAGIRPTDEAKARKNLVVSESQARLRAEAQGGIR